MQCWANWGLQRALGIGQIQTYGLKTGNEVSAGGKGSEQLMKGSLCAPLKCASVFFVFVVVVFKNYYSSKSRRIYKVSDFREYMYPRMLNIYIYIYIYIYI